VRVRGEAWVTRRLCCATAAASAAVQQPSPRPVTPPGHIFPLNFVSCGAAQPLPLCWSCQSLLLHCPCPGTCPTRPTCQPARTVVFSRCRANCVGFSLYRDGTYGVVVSLPVMRIYVVVNNYQVCARVAFVRS
jgi:hypothetical protein